MRLCSKLLLSCLFQEMSERLGGGGGGSSTGRPASIAVSHPAAAAEAAASTSGFQPARRRKDSLPTPTKDELK